MYYFVGMILTVRHLYYCPLTNADIVSYMREFGVRVLSVISLAAIANGKRPVPSHFLRKRLKQLTTTDSTEPPLFRYSVYLVQSTPLVLATPLQKVHHGIKDDVNTD